MTTRRPFLGSALFAASAATLPCLALGRTAGRTGRIKTEGASHGIVVTERDGVVKDLQAFLGA